jgi:TRAP-type transport system periplasmic protein
MMVRLLAGTVVAVLLATTFAWAQDKTVTLKMSSWVPPAHPLNASLIAWAADIEKESGGSIKVTLFPSGSWGKHSIITTWRAMGSRM